jgi:2-amino-4-hydroxy-6-hydroxymethyldihydropteridine diphosphokinase
MIVSAQVREVWLALGSNLGDRQHYLSAALERLAGLADFSIMEVSAWIETTALGGPAGQGDFLNGVLCARTSLDALALLDELQRIELELGRERRVHHGPRTLDLDLLFFGDEVIDHPRLQVPHPELEQRSFVLEPLATLAPRMMLAGCGLSVGDRLQQLVAGTKPTELEQHAH